MASETRDPHEVTATDFEPGATYHDVPWDVYRALRDDESNNGLRMTYLDGTLILMSPEFRHESPAEQLGLVVRAVAGASRIKLRGLRSTTLWQKGRGRTKGSGKEPDTAFHIGRSVDLSRGMTDLSLDRYPPPDLAIESVNKSDSPLILPLYARLGVPELWFYHVRPRELWFGRLTGDAYETVDRSVCLPSLTPELALEALDGFDLDDPDEVAWNAWLQEWARGLSTPPRL